MPATASSEQQSDECSPHNTISRHRCPRFSSIWYDGSKMKAPRRDLVIRIREPLKASELASN
jgi:hypothetical protein